MSGLEGIKKPTTAPNWCDWNAIRDLFELGGKPGARLIRLAHQKFGPPPPDMRKYLRTRGRPLLPPLQKDVVLFARSQMLIAAIRDIRHERRGSQADAFREYARRNKLKPASVAREYRRARADGAKLPISIPPGTGHFLRYVLQKRTQK